MPGKKNRCEGEGSEEFRREGRTIKRGKGGGARLGGWTIQPKYENPKKGQKEGDRNPPNKQTKKKGL